MEGHPGQTASSLKVCAGQGPFIGLESKTFPDREEIVLDNPVVTGQRPVIDSSVLIFNNAAHPDFRQCKSLHQQLDSLPFNDGLFKWLAGEFDNRTIRTDGPGLQVLYVVNAFGKWDFDISPALAFFGEYLDPVVNKFELGAVIDEIGIVELDGRGS